VLGHASLRSIVAAVHVVRVRVPIIDVFVVKLVGAMLVVRVRIVVAVVIVVGAMHVVRVQALYLHLECANNHKELREHDFG
jgi:hypothetical protein